MTQIDQQLLFTSMGFLAVLIKGESTQEDGAARATAMASIIELFCRTTRPDLFPDEEDEKAEGLDQMIESLKASLHTKQLLGLTSDQGLLHRLYNRLLQRHRSYATDDLIADEIVHLLEEEIKHAAQTNMRAVQFLEKDTEFLVADQLDNINSRAK